MTITEPGTERGRRTRDALVRAAESVFAEHGYDHASIQLITREAGVAQGTFYLYFPSKHALFVHLLEELGGRVRSRLADAAADLDADAPRSEVERIGLEAFFRFVLDHPALYRVVREAEFVAPETHRWYYDSFIDAYLSAFRRRSETPDGFDPEVLAWFVIGVADVFGRRWVIREQTLPPEEALDQLTAMLAVGVDGVLK